MKMLNLRKEASHPWSIVSTGAGQLGMKRKKFVLETSADLVSQHTKIIMSIRKSTLCDLKKRCLKRVESVRYKMVVHDYIYSNFLPPSSCFYIELHKKTMPVLNLIYTYINLSITQLDIKTSIMTSKAYVFESKNQEEVQAPLQFVLSTH
jgi:hypothetical protein